MWIDDWGEVAIKHRQPIVGNASDQSRPEMRGKISQPSTPDILTPMSAPGTGAKQLLVHVALHIVTPYLILQ
ncbi:hypothetical protein LMH87_011317 [Akanthomyces muscarius]|uniref:Uncharacterized protein n=1 Tax=Akanthomyces muscarius TaxID=2231603 RepID=A0A9W8UIC5_AKAMU|nr:hypothetical protein LMH87_011317 [Akanthomyces muscarius]KAJ4150573.1 hypothetical protein LMH87_011317 [Akanthomyces muscarius]